MSTEENKALVQRLYEAYNKHNLAGILELCAPDYVLHGTGGFPDMDLAGMKQACTALFTAFPDVHWVMEDVIAEGDKVVVRRSSRGTHQGDFLGIPPTGNVVTGTGIEIDRIEDGKFVETWDSFDLLGLMQQLGAIRQMAQGGA